jgi:hypothetical protein
MALTKEQIEKLRNKVKQTEKKGGEDFKEVFVQLKEGVDKEVRILPAMGEDPTDFYVATAVHKVGEERHICPKLKKEDCPICDLYFSIWEDINAIGKDDPSTEPFKKFARTLRAGDGYYLNVYDRDEKKVKILYAGQKVMNKILNGNLDEDLGNGETMITDTLNGWDFRIAMKKVAGYNNYDDSKFRGKSSPLAPAEEIEKILADRKDLTVFVQYSDPKDLRRVADNQREFYRENVAQVSDTPGSPSGKDDSEFKKELELQS